jgi:hypothetical protein
MRRLPSEIGRDSMDRARFQIKLTATAQLVALVERDLAAIRQPVDALADARDNAHRAALGLTELHELLNDVTDPKPAMRECAACGKSVMWAATRCGSCWTKIVFAANG